MTLKIGVLGAANISQIALYDPVADTDKAEIVAIAARDRGRAEQHASAQGIGTVHGSYQEVLADPEVEAVYNPLPISLHATWSKAALRAGKHVLSEKPFAANTELAAELAATADAEGRLCMEAFHWRYHPMADEIAAVLTSGVLGDTVRLDAVFNVEINEADDVRQSYELGGGALMDLGCYPVQWVRFACGGEPVVTSAVMQQGRPNADVDTRIELECPGQVPASIQTVMTPGVEKEIYLKVTGSDATLLAENPLAPQFGNRLLVTSATGETLRDDSIHGRSTYHHQLDAFIDAVQHGTAVPTGGADAVNNMKVIDAAYHAAGLPLRQESQ